MDIKWQQPKAACSVSAYTKRVISDEYVVLCRPWVEVNEIWIINSL